MAFEPEDSDNGMILLPTQGPWGNRGTGGGGDNQNGGGGDSNGGGHWNRPGGGGGKQDEPDLDEMLRQAQDKFKTGGGKRPASSFDPGHALFLLLGALFLIWLSTGFYTVQPQENAIILTFGKVTDTKTEPGLGYHLPNPIQEDIKLDVTGNRRLNIGFQESSGSRIDNPVESIMLTEDQNIVNIHFSVFWHIGNAEKYTFDIFDPDSTVKKVAESAMREVIGQMAIQKEMTEGRAEIESKTKELLQKVLDDYQSGVIINSVQLLSVDPPAPVVDAFNDVQRARTDKERMKNEAETYQNEIVPTATGEATKITVDAEAYKAAVIAKAQGEADRFVSVYDAYAQSKDVTQRRIYLDTMEDVLKNSRKFIVTNDKGVLPWLPLDDKTAGRTPPQAQ